MPGHQNYARSPMCDKHDMVNCWDCGKSMKQKNINGHYKYEKMKNHPAHVGKEPHSYKPNLRSFSFNIVKPKKIANTKEQAEKLQEQVESPNEQLEKAEDEVQVKVEKLKEQMKRSEEQQEKPEKKAEIPEKQVKIQSEDQEQQPEMQKEKPIVIRKRNRQPSIFSYQSQLIQFKQEVKKVIDEVTHPGTLNYLQDVQKSLDRLGEIRK